MTIFDSDQRFADEVNEMTKRNPLASPFAIGLLTELEQLVHPNCPTERWWHLAAFHPEEAQASPLFALLTLETPERWTGMAETLVNRQSVAIWDTLPPPTKLKLLGEFNARPLVTPGSCIMINGMTEEARSQWRHARSEACFAEAKWKLARMQACVRGEK